MKFLQIIFLMITFLLFIAEINYGLYVTAIVQTIALFLLFYSTFIIRSFRISRLLILIVFILSYPIQVVIIASGNTTFSGFHLWVNNSFSFQDTQVAIVILVSSFFYWILICIHCILSLNSMNSSISSNYTFKRKYLKHKYKTKFTINSNLCLWVLFLMLGLIVIIQNKLGWAIWGIPPYYENRFRLVGITYYLRDYIIPILIFFFLFFAKSKITFFIKFSLLVFSLILSLISLSKVTLIFYFLLLTYAVQRDYIIDKTYKRHVFRKYFMWIFLFSWGVFIYYWQSVGRVLFINAGIPIYNQLFLMLDLEIFNDELINIFFVPGSLYSFIERFLGFQGLASSLFYEEILYYKENFLGELNLSDVKDLETNSAKSLISSEQMGGFGTDTISKFIIMGYYMPLSLLLILINFFCQIQITKSFPEFLQKVVEIVLIILFLRFFIDGNLNMLKIYTYILIFYLIFLYSFCKIKTHFKKN
ncbi:hypothetical protein MCEMKE138_00239 [Candidatus Pelagibacterales bacterium]